MKKPSIGSYIYKALLVMIKKKKKFSLTKEMIEAGRKAPRALPSKRLRKKYDIDSYSVQGHTVWTISPKNISTDQHVFYLHGGAYVNGIHSQHWYFISTLATKLPCHMTIPDYPLAPEYKAHDTVSMVFETYRKLTDKISPSKITIMGDSSGGGMGLALAQYLKKCELPQPKQLILLSPWLDITMTNPEIPEMEKRDIWLGLKGTTDAAEMYAGDMEKTDYLVSPLYGDLKDLAPITLYIGTHDILLPDCRKLKEKADREGICLDYHEYNYMFHDWMLLNFPEAQKVRNEIIAKLDDLI